jgi:hypothetical protein
MQSGLLGLVLWSFLMASGHGAGLMLIPALAPICGSLSADAAMPTALAARPTFHGDVAGGRGHLGRRYIWIGVDFLRRGWINLDIVWVLALGICGVVLLVT